MNKLTLALLLLQFAVATGGKPKSVIHVVHLSPTSVGITCENGADPTGTKVGETVIVSCAFGGR